MLELSEDVLCMVEVLVSVAPLEPACDPPPDAVRAPPPDAVSDPPLGAAGDALLGDPVDAGADPLSSPSPSVSLSVPSPADE